MDGAELDPELNLLYIGTSVTSPAPKFMVGGADNRHLYHNSTLALDADTGEIVGNSQRVSKTPINMGVFAVLRSVDYLS